MKNPFQIGDRVRAVGGMKSGANMKVIGLTGTIIDIEPGNLNRFAVRFDEDFGGHSCDRRTEYGHGQWMHYLDLDFEGEVVDLDCDISNLI